MTAIDRLKELWAQSANGPRIQPKEYEHRLEVEFCGLWDQRQQLREAAEAVLRWEAFLRSAETERVTCVVCRADSGDGHVSDGDRFICPIPFIEAALAATEPPAQEGA